ncbi:MAG: endonuclease III [Candidatus Omnitrophica bacterium]|nr:endonuclease III [Candidatus Omnitrophota bacterium]
MNKKANKILVLLKKEYPHVKIALDFGKPLEILVATILSAQCTDARVNIVTKTIFKKYRKLEDYANAKQSIFEQEIRSTGFYRNKAKNIIAAAKMIISDFKGKVPDKMEELLKLPGVARKTANVVLYGGYAKIAGIAVDTHVNRLSQRLGLSKNSDPNKIELDLMRIVPKKEWGRVSLLFIQHGRKICDARKPKCAECALLKLCPSKNVFQP